MLDCHCHLLDSPGLPDFFLNSQFQCHVDKIYCNTVAAQQWPDLRVLAKSQPGIIPFYGIHPWHIDADSVAADLQLLATFLDNSHSFCGEIGLDRLSKTNFALQEEVFRRQLDIAMDTKSFVAIHCVKAWGRLLEILETYQGKIGFMVHAFQGSQEIMARLVALGGMISFSDRVLSVNHPKFHNVLKKTPLDNLLLETDFPFHKSNKGISVKTYCQVLTNLYDFVSRQHSITVAELTKIIENNGSLCTY